MTTLGLLAIGGVLAVFWHYGRDLPDHHQLEAYNPPVTTRVYAGDGRLVAEYAVEKRNFVPLNAIPQRVKQAFMAAEDKNFYNHPGIDVMGVGRAMLTNLKSMGSDRRPVGASTVTQQVAKNFLLSNEVSMARKVKELILALRMERAFTKDHILELYLNEIYLGMGSYGVAAAAMNYFNRGLDQLSVAELAYLAALPKAPNNYNPFRHPLEAKGRRDWVIGRMLEDGYITAEEAKAAIEQSLEVRRRSETELAVGGDYFAEDIRRDLASKYGEGVLYKGGLTVRSTMDPVLQDVANRALRNGLMAYDRRHGWRGAITRIEAGQGWPERLVAVVPPNGLDPRWRLAVVLGLQNDGAEIGLASGEKGRIPFTEMKWARPALDDNKLGAVPRKPGDVVQVGDVVAVELIRKGDDGANYAEGIHTLRQIPKV
ncbi:MAG: transglycosylase domain-containing protein, partial [Rhodospirillales bacterium]|nr:transglycosylase domain-containing protein [Rhodospirillales bacterium]